MEAPNTKLESVSYDEYTPKHYSLGPKHPDPACENATLASIDPPAFAPGFALKIQDAQKLSCLQLEAIAYATASEAALYVFETVCIRRRPKRTQQRGFSLSRARASATRSPRARFGDV